MISSSHLVKALRKSKSINKLQVLQVMVIFLTDLQPDRCFNSACFKQGYVLWDMVAKDFSDFLSVFYDNMFGHFRETFTLNLNLIIFEGGPSMNGARVTYGAKGSQGTSTRLPLTWGEPPVPPAFPP